MSTELSGFTLVDQAVPDRLAPAQSAAMFCLQPETLPIFIAWLKRYHHQPPEWYEAGEIARDLSESVAWIDKLIEAQHG